VRYDELPTTYDILVRQPARFVFVDPLGSH
jgi:hypothetical protein